MRRRRRYIYNFIYVVYALQDYVIYTKLKQKKIVVKWKHIYNEQTKGIERKLNGDGVAKMKNLLFRNTN